MKTLICKPGMLLAALLAVASCGPAHPPLTSGHRDSEPDAVVCGVGVSYFYGAGELDRLQLDETTCAHMHLADAWLRARGIDRSQGARITVRWYRDRLELERWRLGVSHWTDFHARPGSQAAYWDPVTKTIAIARTKKNTSDPKRNPLSEFVLHVYVGDYAHAGAWSGYMQAGGNLDRKLLAQR